MILNLYLLATTRSEGVSEDWSKEWLQDAV
jgi:hypothetical protein